ncbi:MAG: phenylalanine--tRNA ligase beta subunit-related protein [Desulfurococcaceae archaeon]
MTSELCTGLDNVLEIDEDCRKLGIYVAYTILWIDAPMQLNQYPFETDVKNLLEHVKRTHTIEDLKDNPVVRAYRDFYWRIGIDPTKTRPAGEALVRRALKGVFPRINPVVDAGNIASTYTIVPVGIYDLGRVKLPLKITMSKGGEVFKPIGGGVELLDKDIPVLIDSENKVMHIYPHRDSVETMVREHTTRILVIAAGVLGVSRELVKKTVEKVAELLNRIGWKWCNKVVLVA